MSARVNDEKGRFRSKTIAFRVSPEENDYLNQLVALSGLTKQDYLIKKISDQSVVVNGNPRVFKALKTQMQSILIELKRIDTSSDMDSDFSDMVRTVCSLYARLLNSEE